jgi:hypothetical protein
MTTNKELSMGARVLGPGDGEVAGARSPGPTGS